MKKSIASMVLSISGLLCGVGGAAVVRPERPGLRETSGVGGSGGHDACMESRLISPLPGRDESGRMDPETGRDLLNYPPDRLVDFDHMLLRLFIPDMNTPRAEAVQSLRFTPIGGPLSSLTLDAVGLDVSKVEVGGQSADFSTDGVTMTVKFDPALPAGQTAEITTTYAIDHPRGGMIWTPQTPDWPGRAAQIHTQGEPQTASYWFPCHDFPNEKLTTQLVVTVPEGYIVSSNGHLVSQRSVSVGGREYETFDWLQGTPHPNYLVTMVVGQFDVVDVASGGRGAVPMPVYVPPGRGGDVEATYGRTAEMVRFFSERLDEAYPWDQYAQLVVWNFGWGGMENTSATTMYDTAILSPDALVDHDLEGLISHELGHQWFGDLVTCNSWEHIWLNEGWATYMSALWFEHSRGPDDYQASIRGNFDGVIGAATGHAPQTPPMVSKVWAAPWETFRRQNNPYPMGSSMLHMLRRRLGDEVFFRGVAEYLDRMGHRSAETRDFRRAMEDVSGQSLERFFWQWAERPGVPRLRIGVEWRGWDWGLDETAARRMAGRTPIRQGSLVIKVEQTQLIDGYNPAYAFDLPVLIGMSDGRGGVGEGGDAPGVSWTSVPLSVGERSRTFTIPLDREPTMVCVDPEMCVLAELDVDQPLEGWVEQVEHGPSLSARVLAARAIGAHEASATRKAGSGGEDADVLALRRVALDPHAHSMIRNECVLALARRDDLGVMIDPGDAGLPPAVRVTALNAMSGAVADRGAFDADDRARVAGVARGLMDAAQPTTLRAAAVRALGRLRADGAFDLIVAALGVESQDDAIRQAALDAMADLDDARGLGLAIGCTHPRTNSRTRATAIGAVVRLAHHDRDAAFNALAPLLRDDQRRTFLASGQALVDLGDQRGLGVLRSLRDEVTDPDTAWSLDSWIHALREKSAAESDSASEHEAAPAP